MTGLWQIYHREIPDFLQDFSATPPLKRLQQVGMNCGCEYTAFPRFATVAPYSRFTHSMGVALIVWHFTGDMRQSVAGLLHDVATPAFSHVVDFLHGDHLRQESTEAKTAAWIADSPQLQSLLARYGLNAEEVADYHRYPIADNPSPRLSADRLEYTLGNLLGYGFSDLSQVRSFYQDLTIWEDPAGTPELAFRSPEVAESFTEAALQTARVYVAQEDRFVMQALADLLANALDRGVLSETDLWETEPHVISKLLGDEDCAARWGQFCRYSRIVTARERPANGYWVRVPAKLRFIDPLALGRGRVSQWSCRLNRLLAEFQRTNFSAWLSAV